MKRQLSQKEIEKRKSENEDDIHISRREKKRQQFTKKSNDPYQEEENYQWENEK